MRHLEYQRKLHPLALGAALIAMIATASLWAGCRHKVYPNTRHGNHLLFNPAGTLHGGHLDGPEKCSRKMGEGKIRLSFRNGKKRLVGHCRGGLRVGRWKAWYNNGALAWKATYRHGLIEGKLKIYHPNDRKLAVLRFDKGALNGRYKAWWRNGHIRAKGKFVANKRNGCWETWHKNGQKASKGTYADDRKVLTWLYWTSSGRKRKEKLGGEAKHGRCLLVF